MNTDHSHISISFNGFFGRLWIYLVEMFPLHRRIPEAVLLGGSFILLLYFIHDISFSQLSSASVLGVANIILVLLLLRLMDELKDKEIDRQLFAERPLPSKRIFESDIKIAMIATILIFLSINFAMGMIIFWAACTLFVYTLLMFRYFFIPHILRNNLLLNLATHNPVVPLILIYLVVVFTTSNNLAFENLDLFSITLLVLMYWGVLFSWEITRKIRSREEENAYVTYSQLLGRRGAVVLAAGSQTVSFLIGIYLFAVFAFSIGGIVLLTAGYLYIIYGHIRFLLNPVPATSNLASYTERYAVILFITIILDFSLF